MAKEFLSSQGVEFDAKDVTANPANLQEMLEVTGGLRGVPVIVVGTDVIRGFDRDRLTTLLGPSA